MRILIIFLLLAVASVVIVSGSSAQQATERTAEQQFKNIQIFKALPATQRFNPITSRP